MNNRLVNINSLNKFSEKEQQLLLAEAWVIISESGIEAFSLKTVIEKTGLRSIEIKDISGIENEIIYLLVEKFRSQFQVILSEIPEKKLSPIEELETLFRSLYKLFKTYPIFLSFIFDVELLERFSNAEKVIIEIRNNAFIFLSQLIDTGKNYGSIISTKPTKVLAREILGSFRNMISDVQLTDKLLRELTKLKSNKD